MKVIVVAAISIDGKLTRGSETDIHAWTSDEDHKNHNRLIVASRVIIMGRNTYDVWQLKAKPGRLVIVLTAKPDQYKDKQVKDQLEFTNETAAELVDRLEKQGHKEAMVDGGGHVNGEFMKAGLVTDIFLTIEPHAFGVGTELFAQAELNSELELKSIKRLNDKGSLLLHYSVSK